MLPMLIKIIHYLFLVYTALIAGRIIGSWFPAIAGHPAMRFVAFYTDPYLNLFRRIIPPIGGVLDSSPMLGFFVLQFLETILIRWLI